jgi:sulfate adenylyltransferase
MIAAPGSIVLSNRQLCDLVLIGNGAFAPLDGFMGEADYQRVVAEMRLANGSVWSIPVTLAVDESAVPPAGATVELRDDAGRLRGTLVVRESFRYDKEREAREVYGTTDAAHPGVAALYAQGDILLAGQVNVVEQPPSSAYDLTPAQTKALFEAFDVLETHLRRQLARDAADA